MTIVIRRGVETDATALADLAARTFQDAFGADNRPEDMALHVASAYGPTQQRRELADPDITTLLAEGGRRQRPRHDPLPGAVSDMTTRTLPARNSRALVLGTLVLSAAASGCMIPVNTIEPVSPMLTGVVRTASGLPSAGRRVAVADWRDERCRRPLATSRTNDRGEFGFGEMTRRVRWLMIFPAFETFGTTFFLCAAVDDTLLGVVHQGYAPFTRAGVEPDTLRCFEWHWKERTRMTCGARETLRSSKSVQSAGRWTDSAGSGFYRLILAGQDGESGRQEAAFLQWVEGSSDSAGPVRHVVKFALVPEVVDVDEARFLHEGDTTRLLLRSRAMPRGFSFRDRRRCDFVELGAPGQLRWLACPR